MANASLQRMIRFAQVLFLLCPTKRRNNLDDFHLIRLASSYSLGGAPTARSARSGMATTSGPAVVDDVDNKRFIVTRNGNLMPWAQVHQRYEADSHDRDNGAAEPNASPMDAGTLLQVLPRGAYTTCRTVRGGTRVYQFDYHVKRLSLSARSILESIAGDGDEAASSSAAGLSGSSHPRHHERRPSRYEISRLQITDEAWEREMALGCIRSSLDEFCSRYQMSRGGGNGNDASNHEPEFRISLLATWEKAEEEEEEEGHQRKVNEEPERELPFQSVLYCHVGILPQNANAQRERRIRVLVHGHGRENALAKDSKWVSDRKKLTMPEDSKSYEEIILINDSGEMLEGTQTNFYVVKDGSIATADEGILYGSVRDSVLRVCQSHGITVELRPPTLDDLRHASGVFISSTSRLVMPVHEVVLGDLLTLGGGGGGALPQSYCYPKCATTENVRRWVLEDVETHSTVVCGSSWKPMI